MFLISQPYSNLFRFKLFLRRDAFKGVRQKGRFVYPYLARNIFKRGKDNNRLKHLLYNHIRISEFRNWQSNLST